jgi:peptide/nickel transport system substrate-binding protein
MTPLPSRIGRRGAIGRAFAIVAAVYTVMSGEAPAQEKVLRAAMHADLRILDPHWTTAVISLTHGILVYDTLFAFDDAFQPQPQMVASYEVSPDNLTYTMTLRDGLRWHDGSPVRARDIVASIRRWGARNTSGQRLLRYTTSLDSLDDRRFRLVLDQPYRQVLRALAQHSAVMMREREARIDPATQVTEAIGSGPFKFARDRWVPGSKAVYERNADYVPRTEPARGLAGGKVAGVDRIEFLWIPDEQTAAQALIKGEIDLLENASVDFVPILEAARNVSLRRTAQQGGRGVALIRLNHLHPPFDKVAMRQAMYKLVNQEDFLRAAFGNPDYFQVCHSLLPCGTSFANGGGRETLAGYDPKGAPAAFRAAGYRGETITLLHATDLAGVDPMNQVLIQAMRDAGLKLEVQSLDWGTVAQRVPRRDPPAQGGWNLYMTATPVTPSADPSNFSWLAANCDKARPGWPCDERIEALRDAWDFAETDGERMRIATELQARAVETVVFIPTGQYSRPLAYRSDRLTGPIPGIPGAGVTALWGITRK